MTNSTTSTAVTPFEGDMDPGEKRSALAMWKYAQQLAQSNLAGDLKGKPDDVFAVVAFAAQFGVEAGNAIQMIWIISGRIVPRSEFLAAITRRAGHEIRFEESSSERCTVAIRRREDDYWQRVTFTADDADRAGLINKDIWKKFRSDMLCHATVRRAVKRIVPDVLLGLDVGGDDGVPADRYRRSDRATATDRVVDVELDWDDDDPAAAPDGDEQPAGDDDVEDAEIVEPPAAGGDAPVDPAVARERAMKKLMVTCTNAFPEPDAPKGTKTARQRQLRHAAQYAVIGEHRSAADLTTEELDAVEKWVWTRFLDESAATPTRYELYDDGRVKFSLGDKSKIVPAPDDAANAA